MVKNGWLWATLLAMLTLVGCGGSDGGDDEDEVISTLRFVNAVSDAPTLYLYTDEGDDDDRFIASADFGKATDQKEVGSDEYDLVIYLQEDDELEDIDVRLSTHLDDEQHQLIVVYGTVDNMQTMVIDYAHFNDDNDTAQVGVIGLAESAGELDFYLAEEGDGVFDSLPVTTTSYGQFSGMQVIEEGDYQILLTEPGDNNRVYDGGEIDIDEDSSVILALVDDHGLGEPWLVIEMSGDASSQTYPNLENWNEPLALRIFNAIPDNAWGEVDIYLGNSLETPLFEAVPFSSITDFVEMSVPEEEYPDYYLNVTPHGVKDSFLLQRSLNLNRGEVYTLVLSGLAEEDSVGSLVATESQRDIYGQARLRFVHASPSIESGIDFYLLRRGQAVNDGDPLTRGIDFLRSIEYAVEDGEYDVYLLDSENDTEITGPFRVSLDAGDNKTLHYVDQIGGGSSGQLIAIDGSYGDEGF